VGRHRRPPESPGPLRPGRPPGRRGDRHRRERPTLERRLQAARHTETEAVGLADDVHILADWMGRDVLALAGPDLATRRELFDFVLQELRRREARCPHRLTPVRRMLERARDDLLAFAGVLEERFEELAARFGVPRFLVQAVAENEGRDDSAPAFWQHRARLYHQLGGRLQALTTAVREGRRGDRPGPVLWSRTSTAACGRTSSCVGRSATTTWNSCGST